jgi:hypothetical protein
VFFVAFVVEVRVLVPWFVVFWVGLLVGGGSVDRDSKPLFVGDWETLLWRLRLVGTELMSSTIPSGWNYRASACVDHVRA